MVPADQYPDDDYCTPRAKLKLREIRLPRLLGFSLPPPGLSLSLSQYLSLHPSLSLSFQQLGHTTTSAPFLLAARQKNNRKKPIFVNLYIVDTWYKSSTARNTFCASSCLPETTKRKRKSKSKRKGRKRELANSLRLERILFRGSEVVRGFVDDRFVFPALLVKR